MGAGGAGSFKATRQLLEGKVPSRLWAGVSPPGFSGYLVPQAKVLMHFPREGKEEAWPGPWTLCGNQRGWAKLLTSLRSLLPTLVTRHPKKTSRVFLPGDLISYNSPPGSNTPKLAAYQPPLSSPTESPGTRGPGKKLLETPTVDNAGEASTPKGGCNSGKFLL